MIQTATSTNPLYAHGTPPRFDEITPALASEAVPALLKAARKEFAAFEESLEPTWDGIFGRLKEIVEPLEYAWHVTGHLMGVRNSDELRAVYEELEPQVVEFFTAMGQSATVYAALEELKGDRAGRRHSRRHGGGDGDEATETETEAAQKSNASVETRTWGSVKSGTR